VANPPRCKSPSPASWSGFDVVASSPPFPPPRADASSRGAGLSLSSTGASLLSSVSISSPVGPGHRGARGPGHCGATAGESGRRPPLSLPPPPRRRASSGEVDARRRAALADSARGGSQLLWPMREGMGDATGDLLLLRHHIISLSFLQSLCRCRTFAGDVLSFPIDRSIDIEWNMPHTWALHIIRASTLAGLL
jgi:hypothetical protein